jgi:hypothetical protein
VDQGTAPDPAMWSLRSRGPAHTASLRVLDVQRAAGPRGFLARLFGADPLHPDAVGSYRGALGELRVGRMLRDLGPEWRVLHALPHGEDSDIDHLVIGPAGVFSVTSRLAGAEGDARAASRVLTRASGAPVVATPVVAVLDTASIRTADPAQPVALVAAHRLVRHLRDLPIVYGPDLVATLARAAEDWTAWRPFAAEPPRHRDPVDAFEQLREEIQHAHERRTIWRNATVAGVLVTFFGVASALFSE